MHYQTQVSLISEKANDETCSEKIIFINMKMIRKVSIVLGVALVCTFGSTSNSSISNDTISVVKSTISSLISNDTTDQNTRADATSTQSSLSQNITEEIFELPESCSNYKVKFCLHNFHLILHLFMNYLTFQFKIDKRNAGQYQSC